MLEFDLDHDNPRRNKMRKMTLAALLAAAAVLLSPLSFPLGPSRCFPFQHAVNAVAGVILGPFWAFGSALVASFVRNVLGTGTLLFQEVFSELYPSVLPPRCCAPSNAIWLRSPNPLLQRHSVPGSPASSPPRAGDEGPCSQCLRSHFWPVASPGRSSVIFCCAV